MAYRTPRDFANRLAARRRQKKIDDGFARETFTQPRDQAQQTARAFLDRWPAAAYMSAIESWRATRRQNADIDQRRDQRCHQRRRNDFGSRYGFEWS